MKKILASLCAVSLLASAYAGDAKEEKDLKKIIENEGIYVETAQKGVTLSGYVDTSYTYQFASGSNGGTTESTLRAFDTDTGFNINAVKIALEKALPKENEYAAGFRVDAIAGEDAKILNGSDAGLSFAGVAAPSLQDSFYLEQAYVQFRAPIGNGLDFKFGKFVTLLGYEVIESPANLNFSRGLLYQNAIPVSHTGVLASYKFNDIVDAQFGIVNGWNSSDATTTPNASQNFATSVPSFTGRVNVTAPGGNANIANSFVVSPEGEGGNIGQPDNTFAYVWDVWGNWAPKFANDKLLLGFNLDLGAWDGSAVAASDTWWGAALYAKYQFTKVFSLAGRAEYLHDSASAKIAVGAGSSDVYSWTLTAGFNIWENLLTRVEYRYDFSQNDVFDGGDQHELSLNLVYSF